MAFRRRETPDSLIEALEHLMSERAELKVSTTDGIGRYTGSIKEVYDDYIILLGTIVHQKRERDIIIPIFNITSIILL